MDTLKDFRENRVQTLQRVIQNRIIQLQVTENQASPAAYTNRSLFFSHNNLEVATAGFGSATH